MKIMGFRLGLVGLCSSHPGNWVPILRQLKASGEWDVEVVAAWDSGETRPLGYAADFCLKTGIPHALETLDEMPELVDGVIIHSVNWDRHLEQARPFIAAGKSVFIDKPIIGCMQDAATIRVWQREGHRISGGSALRFTREVRDWALNFSDVHTAYSAVGTDEFNYGIHGYSLLSQVMGPGIASAKYLTTSGQRQILLNWHDGRCAFLTVGKTGGLPFNVTAVTASNVFQARIDNSAIYLNLLRAQLPYLTGTTDTPPVPPEFLLEPEMAALAARASWLDNGRTVCLNELNADMSGYDGTVFAEEYRKKRFHKTGG